MTSKSTPRQQPLFVPTCIHCDEPLINCAARWVMPENKVTSWEKYLVCHNPECALYNKAFPASNYKRAAKAALRGNDQES